MRLEDGTGSGKYAAVTNENLLKTLSNVVEFVHHVNHSEREAYSAVFNVTPAGPDSIFLYIKNLSDLDLVVYELTIFADSTENIDIYLSVTGTPVNGNELTPTNRTSGAANTADCVAHYGSNITGLIGGNIVDRFILTDNLQESKKIYWHSGFIVPKNTTFVLKSGVGSGANLKGTLAFYFHGLVN